MTVETRTAVDLAQAEAYWDWLVGKLGRDGAAEWVGGMTEGQFEINASTHACLRELEKRRIQYADTSLTSPQPRPLG